MDRLNSFRLSRSQAVALAVFLLPLIVATALIGYVERYRFAEAHDRAAELARYHAVAIQRQVEQSLSVAHVVAALVRQGRGHIQDFDATAKQLLPVYRGVAALQLAPAGIVQRSVPLLGNEKIIGQNLLKDPALQQASLAKDRGGNLVLAGPFNSGGNNLDLAMAGNLPVFIAGAHGSSPFWGFVTVQLKLPDLLSTLHLDDLVQQGIDYELWRVHPDSGQKQVIASSSTLPLIESVEQTLELPGALWTLSVAPAKGWRDNTGLVLKGLLSLFFALTFAYSAKLLAEVRLSDTALKNVANAVIIADSRGMIEWVNPAFSALTGYAEKEAVGRKLQDLVKSGEHTPEFYENIWRTLLAGQVWRGEVVNRRKDGRLYYEDKTITPLRDMTGKVQHFIAVKMDITNRVEIERALALYRDHLKKLVAERTAAQADSEARFRGLVEQTIAGVYILQDGMLCYANQRFAEIFGYASPAELIGLLPIEQLMVSAERERMAAIVRRSLSGEAAGVRYSFVGLRKDGRLVDIEGHVHRIEHHGQPALTGFVLDITERKEAERAHEASLKESERLLRIKSEFLANMSHEIRTPLNAVLGLAEIGWRSSAGKTGETFSRILDSGELLLGVINDILDFSKIEAGKLVIEQIPIDLGLLIDRVVELNAESARAKGLVIRVDQAPDLPAGCLGDSLRMSQVLINLLSNAVKFTERGSITLSVKREGGQLIFRITDTGIGMNEEQLKRLFTAFEQASSATPRLFGGTGLGLTISERLIDLMGGTITVESIPEQSTTFEVRLPLIEATPPPRPAMPVAVQHGPRLQGVRVLVADDNPVNQMVLEEMLREEGVELTCVNNGQQALERLALDGADAWDIVLMDVMMPVMDGYEAARRICQLPPGPPVVGLTALALAEERNQCLAAGMVEHVAKPVKLETLVDVILRHARHQQDRPAAASPYPINWSGLEARYKGRAEFVTRLAMTALESHKDTPAQLRTTAQQKDFAQLAFVTHSINSMAGNLMADTLCAQSAAVNQAAEQKRVEALDLALVLATTVENFLAALAQRRR